MHFLGEASESETIVYPVGKHVAVKSLKTGGMKFIQEDKDIREISGLYMSKGARRYLAVTVKLINITDPYI